MWGKGNKSKKKWGWGLILDQGRRGKGSREEASQTNILGVGGSKDVG